MNNRPLPSPLEVYDILGTLDSSGIPKPGSARVIDVGSDEFLSFFEREILDDFISNGGATCRFFEGVYGSGKTHLLQLIEDCAVDKGYIVCHIELSKDLDFSKPHIITKHILENCYAVIRGQTVRRFPDLIEIAGAEGLINENKLTSSRLLHPCAQKAIIFASRRSDISPDGLILLRKYLLGEKVLVSEFKRVGLTGIKKPLNERNAEQFLSTILNSIHLLGFKGILLLYDETDRSWISSRDPVPKKVQNAANIIRRFIDTCSSGDIKGTIAIFAVLPNFIQDCINCYPALGQRLARPLASRDIAWRWPVLPVSATNSLFFNIENITQKKEAFFEAAKQKFKDLVSHCEGDLSGIDEEFEKLGSIELNKWATDEYRRELIKVLSACAINRIDIAKLNSHAK
jgi:hypothetical protein